MQVATEASLGQAGVILKGLTQRPLELSPCTLHTTPYTLHTTHFTLHYTLYTLHPQPYTLNPAPYTPYTQVATEASLEQAGVILKGLTQRPLEMDAGGVRAATAAAAQAPAH